MLAEVDSGYRCRDRPKASTDLQGRIRFWIEGFVLRRAARKKNEDARLGPAKCAGSRGALFCGHHSRQRNAERAEAADAEPFAARIKRACLRVWGELHRRHRADFLARADHGIKGLRTAYLEASERREKDCADQTNG